jgi:hypothetical protein
MIPAFLSSPKAAVADSLYPRKCSASSLWGQNDIFFTQAGGRGLRLAKMIRQFQPDIVVMVVPPIVANVNARKNRWTGMGTDVKLPYPGRWQHHRTVFEKVLASLLRNELAAQSPIFFVREQPFRPYIRPTNPAVY